MKGLQLEILTPDAAVFSGEVESVIVQGDSGKFQVLYNHAPTIAMLKAGKIKIDSAEGEKLYTSEDGVIEVLKNKVIILVEAAIAV